MMTATTVLTNVVGDQVQQNLAINTQPFPARAHSSPIVRWVGGKRWLIPLVSDIAYEYLQRTGGRYFEPFLGGGAVALDLGLPGMVLADLCEPLINAFVQARDHADAVLLALEHYKERGTDEATYYAVRAECLLDAAQRAAQFFYLNTTCFNGIYRENSNGEFNVPYGVRTKKLSSFVTRPRLKAFAAAVASSELLAVDFRPVIQRAGAGDLLVIDSPYYGVYDQYLKDRFTVADHIALARELYAAVERGAACIATNNDTPEVRRLYRWASIVSTGEFRRVNRDATKRGKVGCVLISSDPDLLHHAT